MNRLARSLITVSLIVGFKTIAYRFKYAGDIEVSKAIEAYESERYELAIEKLESGLDKNYQSYKPSEVYNLLGMSYFELDRFPQSIKAYEKAVELDPNFYEAWVNLGVVYEQQENLALAGKYYSQALAIDPDDAELHKVVGIINLLEDKPEEAITSLEEAIAIDDEYAEAYAYLAFTYATVDEFDKAEELIQQAGVLGYSDVANVETRIEELKNYQ